MKRIDGRRERTARFGCRKKSGATETLTVMRAVAKQCGPSGRPVPTKFMRFIVGSDVLGGP